MFRKIFGFITLITITISSIVYAQENNPAFSKLESGSWKIENPFKPQLPEIKEPEVQMPDKPPTRISDDDATDNLKTGPGIAGPVVPLPVVKERPLPNVTISGIIWNSDRPQAIINGEVVDIGDIISEIQITGIRKAEIDGLFDGRNVTLQPQRSSYAP